MYVNMAVACPSLAEGGNRRGGAWQYADIIARLIYKQTIVPKGYKSAALAAVLALLRGTHMSMGENVAASWRGRYSTAHASGSQAFVAC